MGHFLAVTAVRAPLADVGQAIQAFCASHDLACKPVTGTDSAERSDATLYRDGDWTIVLWPVYFNVHDFPAAAALSKQLGTVASTVNVYDDDWWCHGVFERGQLLDQFVSATELMEEEPANCAGNAEIIGAVLGVSSEVIAPYLVHIDDNSDLEEKAYPDDEFVLADFWVFCDFWRRCSIHYPVDMSAFSLCLRLGENFTDRLPCNP